MRIFVFASGSSGNCMLISDGATNLLVDAGISMRRVESSLRQAGMTVKDIDGVLVTHEHSDHVSGLKMLLKHYKPPVYAPHTIGNRLRGMLPEIEDSLNIVDVGRPFRLGELDITAFHTPHDTDESVGYRAEGHGSFAIATDMGHVTDEVAEGLTGADTVLIESNHDIRMLSDGQSPFYLKRRILSERGHLSNADCAKLARYLADKGTRRIILGHLSLENNTPELAFRETEALLTGTGTSLYCAPVFGFMSFEIGEKETCSL